MSFPKKDQEKSEPDHDTIKMFVGQVMGIFIVTFFNAVFRSLELGMNPNVALYSKNMARSFT